MDNTKNVRISCPNCNALTNGQRQADGTIKSICPRCKAVVFSVRKGNEVWSKAKLPQQFNIDVHNAHEGRTVIA